VRDGRGDGLIRLEPRSSGVDAPRAFPPLPAHMPTFLVTGSDTGVGKTHVVAALARMFAARVPAAALSANSAGHRAPAALAEADATVGVQIVKVVETGRAPQATEPGDARLAQRLCGADVAAVTLASFPAPIAPAAAAEAVGQTLSCASLVAAARALPPAEWRILEAAGGIATPVDGAGCDWVDFARALGVDAVVLVIPDRLGAINQARLALAYAQSIGVPTGLWLNATAPVDPLVAASTRAGLSAAGLPVWAEQRFGAVEPVDGERFWTLAAAGLSPDDRRQEAPPVPGATLAASADPASSDGLLADRCRGALAERDRQALRRTLRITARAAGVLNLADNDYLELSRDPAVVAAVARAAEVYGTSASASPLITGWGELHDELIGRLARWHGFPCGLLWSSGYAANAAILGGLPQRGDLVLADRLIHHSMVAGLLRSGARLQRFDHLNLPRLEALLASAAAAERQVFVATETLFSMDGDYPDLARMAELKRRYRFCWIVDEAHAVGWYGPMGAGLVAAAGVAAEVDIFVGTFGKALGSGGAYALFRDPAVREYLVNTAGEFIYSTALPPTAIAAASAAVDRVGVLAAQQPTWHEASRAFRRALREAGWAVADGDSPIVPVVLDRPAAALQLADALRAAGILAAAVRPPTVPAGTSRIRFSLKRTFGAAEAARVGAVLDGWRTRP
jgi:8-amino-7-oxononanoate synthase